MLTTLFAAALLVAPPAVQATPIMGGDTVIIGSSICKVGFNAKTSTDQHRVLVPGACVGSSQAIVAATPPLDTTSTPYVIGPNGPITVQGAQQAPIGTAICLFGPTTGTRCGVINAVNVTVRFPEGTLTGLTRTNICSQPGDAALPSVMWRGQAQGVVVGASGNCTTGGSTFFAPVLPALSTWGLTLHTG
ncbi:S1 family peptidase [Actinokineospora sp. 24-640]